MEQKDYLMRQVNMLGIVLGRLLAMLLRQKPIELSCIEIETVLDGIGKEADVDIDQILSVKPEDLVGILIREHCLQPDDLENLATILTLITTESETPHPQRRQLMVQALTLFYYLAEQQGNFSFMRASYIERLLKALSKE